MRLFISSFRRRMSRFPLLVSVVHVTACATYSTSFVTIEAELAAQRPSQALHVLEKQSHPRRDRVLYLLNKGMILRMNQDYENSNQILEMAKTRMDELYGLSLREQTMSFIINDATRSYVGEEYEQILVHIYKALNYLALRQVDAARVEALQIDVKIRQWDEKMPKNGYTEDAFARYLTAIIYEQTGEWSDAMIAYRKAYEAYLEYKKKYAVDVPERLKIDLLRHSERMGLTQEMKKYMKRFNIKSWDSISSLSEQGEIIYLLHNGLAPIKREQAITAIDPNSGHLFRIAVPYYESRPAPVFTARVTVMDKSVATDIYEDINAITRKNLDAKLPAITARAVARMVIKTQAAKNAREDNNALAGMIINIAGLLTERADTRSWLTLPQNIHLARLHLPPGTYKVKVDLLGRSGQHIETRYYENVVVEKQQKTYLSQFWIP